MCLVRKELLISLRLYLAESCPEQFFYLVQPSWSQRAADNRKSFWCVIHEKVLWLSWNKQQGFCLGFIAKAALTVYVGGICNIYFEMQFMKVASSLCPLCLLFMTLIVSSKFLVQVFELPLPQQRVPRTEQGYLLLPLHHASSWILGRGAAET